MRVLLIETTPPGMPGSMAAYAELTGAALSAAGSPADLQVDRLCLAAAEQSFLPHSHRFRMLQLVMHARCRLPRVTADIVHVLDGSLAFVARWLPRGIPRVVTSHDLIPWLQMQGDFPMPSPGGGARWVIRSSLGQLCLADRVVAVSSSTRNDLVRSGCAPEVISVVHNALRQDFAEACRRLPGQMTEGPSQPYVLHVGNNGFYKNREGVLRIFAKVHRTLPSLRLLMAGPSPTEELMRQAVASGIADAVDFLVDPDAVRLAESYHAAALLLFPSLYEGFGWPPLEAMAAGCPVVCSNVASLPEVAGDVALMAPPGDEEQLAGHCLRILTDRTLAKALKERGVSRAAGFSPERMGRELLEVYDCVRRKA